MTAGWVDDNRSPIVEVYSDGKWSLGPQLPKGRVNHCQVQAGTKILVIGDRKTHIMASLIHVIIVRWLLYLLWQH